MKPLSEIELGYSDAENYKKRRNKELFNKVFLRNDALQRLCSDDICFVVGEKGTGKTAYAVYLSNNNLQQISGSLKYIRETDYQKFLELKQQNHLTLSDFTSIWRTILLLLIAKKIQSDEPAGRSIFKRRHFALIQDAIDEYYHHAFSPEILVALQITDETSLFAQLISKHLKAGGEEKEVISFTSQRFQTNLHYIEKKLETAIASVKPLHRHTLFIDGIDIRPTSIPYNEYLDCIKGLGNAVWSLNSDVFGALRDNPRPPRIVLLVRPDILASIALQNTNTKIRDNSVVLDWKTTYPDYRSADIFFAIDRLLSSQQKEEHPVGTCWDAYFPFYAPTEGKGQTTSFISFLRFSLFRPRDIIVMMEILQREKRRLNDDSPVKSKDFNSAEFRKKYSVYLLGEVKDQISFYHSPSEYEAFLKFFEFLQGKYRFEYREFLVAYQALIDYLQATKLAIPEFFESGNSFLQYLFDLNIICYLEDMEDGKTHLHWCYRERSYANLTPKVKGHKTYEIHYALGKALNVGKAYH